MLENKGRLFDFMMGDNHKLLPEQLLRYKSNGEWKHYSPIMFKEITFGLAQTLLEKGINGRGETPEAKGKVGLICFSRPNWLVVDIATQLTGALLVPLYPNITASEIVTIFNEAELTICFVGDMGLYDKIQSVKSDIPTLKDVYVFDNPTPQNDWKQLLQPVTPEVEKNVLENAALIRSEDVATIIYTSGTTGSPKGVMLSHKNILSNIESASSEVFDYFNLGKNESLSFLPLNHILEKMIMYIYLFNSFSVSFAESIETIAANLQEIKPYCFVTVPRLLEKVYEKIMAKGQELTGITRSIFFWSVSLADKFDYQKPQSLFYRLQLAIADKLVYSKWRAALGGNVKIIVVGGAACQQRIIRVFGAAKINILEGYGLTETSPVIAVNRMDVHQRMVGTVGPPLDTVQVKFLEDGEIYVKGDNVMLGYYKRPVETAEVIKDGWFYTGDIGVMENGMLKITDRKKEIFKTSGGKYVVPQPIENKIKENYLIEQMMIVGAGEKFVGALIVPNFVNLQAWCKKNNIAYDSPKEVITKKEVINLFQSIIDKYNPLFNHVEQVKKFVLLSNEWTVDGGELTPSVKIKRKVIATKYEKEIKSIYE